MDFANPIYQASGKERVRIKNTILFLANVIAEEDLPEADKAIYLQVRQQFGKAPQAGTAPSQLV